MQNQHRIQNAIIKHMGKVLPAESRIIEIHKKHAPSKEMYDIVLLNCRAVWLVAQNIIEMKHLILDTDLVRAACLLHDVGTYKLIQPNDVPWVGYVNRGVVGSEILGDEGCPKYLCNAVRHHAGLGLSKERIIESGIGLPHEDLRPRTIEERLVNYASKLHSRSDSANSFSQFIKAKSYRKLLGNIGNPYYRDEFEALVDEFGEPDLLSLSRELRQDLI